MRYKLLKGADLGKYCERVFAKVLFPTDFSKPAEASLSFMKSMSGIGGLVLLHVVSKNEAQGRVDADVTSATKKLNDVSRGISKAGMNTTPIVVVGDPVAEIRSVAEKEEVSLIAMSSHGAVALKRMSIGSTAYEVANSSNRPVLILRNHSDR